MIGKSISHYKILEKLGEGGMGVVYKAEDTKLKRTVALKFLPHHLLANEEDRTRFLHEAQAASSLNHPNIMTIYEVDEIDEETFIAMEYVDGETLKDKLEKGPLKTKELLNISIAVAEGLNAAHEQEIVHRDIKSENIMISKAGMVKIMDFGLAKRKGMSRVTKTGSTLGTLSYMSPEQAEGLEVDVRSDLFSFGVVMYEMVTGQLPFKGEHDAAILYSIVNEAPLPVTTLNPNIPQELERFIHKALEKEVEDRYQHADDLAADLRKLKKDLESGRTTTITTQIPLVKDLEKKPVWQKPAYLSMVVLVGVLFSVGYWFFTQQPETQERIPIAVIDFLNETGDKELDGLSGLLITALEQSRRLEVLTRSRMFDYLRQLNMSDIELIDENAGRAICKAANVSTMAIGTVKKFGGLFSVDLKVIDVLNDKHLFAAKADGKGKETIPSLIDDIAERTRVELREPPQEIREASKKVAEVTTTNLEAYQHYFRGDQLVSKLKFKEAKEELKKAIALDTTFALAYYRLAYARAWSGDERAKESIRKAMKYIEKVPEREQYMIRAENANIQGSADEAITIWQELLELYPEQKEALYELGDWSSHKADYVNAEIYLKKVLALDPTFERALQHIIWLYESIDQYDTALEYAKQYVAKVPSVQAYGLLGSAYHLNGDMDEAFQTYQRALELFPNSTMPVVGIGKNYVFKDEYGKAEAEFKKLLQKSRPLSHNGTGYTNLAWLYPYLGKYREALKMYDNRIGIDLNLADSTRLAGTYAWKALLLAAGRNDRDEVEKAIEKSLELMKIADIFFYIPLFDTYLMIGKYDKASSIAKDHLSKVLPFLDIVVRAHVHRTKGEYASAIRDFETVIQRGNIFYKFFSWYELGVCYFGSGQYDKAIEALNGMHRIYYNFPQRPVQYPKSFYLLGKIYEMKGETKLAIESYEKFLDLWKEADEDLPELIDAKKRLARLKEVG